MKLTTLATVVTLAASAAVSAQPHQHHAQQRHAQRQQAHPVEKRAPSEVIVDVPGPTVIVYWYNGHEISSSEVDEGIANGTLVWANWRLSSSSSSTFVAPLTTTIAAAAAPTSTVSVSSVVVEFSATSAADPATPTSVSSSSVSPASTSAPIERPNVQVVYSSSELATSSSAVVVAAVAISTPATSSAAAAAAATTSSSVVVSSGAGVGAVFPDGELDCSTFPSAYGAVALDYLDIGGWSGIQQPGQTTSSGFSDILTVTSGTCTNGDCCTEGSYCSYACPAGYQKSQWPSTQGATGQSVGGLLCKGGKLHLTNPTMSSSLCMTGSTVVPVMIHNTMSQMAAVCRTDYPGTESETIPVVVEAGSTSNLTCPDADHYYEWDGKATSAQYYVNPAGVSVEDACQWGSGAEPWGNYAPLNLGVGYSAGRNWLSIFPNTPTTDAKLAFTVEIVGDDMSGRCKYVGGMYCTGDNYETCSSSGGCTVSAASGTMTYVFS